MALRETDGSPGAPWERPLRGTLDRLVVESERLAGNPLGDPATRPLWVYRAPGVGDDPVPTVYVIQGYLGQVDAWANRTPFEPSMLERLDEMFASGDCPPALVVFVDAWTSYGGSQFLNSSSTGPYMDYLCDEVVPFVEQRYPALPGPEHRGLTGKSSGGYGAMVVPMVRPDVFGALASHAGDALFECCYQPNFPQLARKLRDEFDGSWDVFWEQFQAADHLDMERFENFDLYGYAAAYSPDPQRPGQGAAAVRDRHRAADRRRLGAVARVGPGADGAAPRRRAALDAARLPRRRQGGRVVPRPRRAGLLGRARQARRRAHARALRRQARRAHLPLSGRDPGARAGATVNRVAAHTLDVTDVTCPLTWVRTKLALERLAPGRRADRDAADPGEALENVPRSAAEAGHDVAVEGTLVRIVRR